MKSLTVLKFSSSAEAEEICNGFGRNIVEKFKIDGLVHFAEIKLHMGVLACLAIVDHLLIRVAGEALVHNGHRVVHVRETVEDISGKLFAVSDVF